MASFWGNLAGTNNSKFQAYIEYEVVSTSGNSQRVRYKYSCYVSQGNFNGVTAHRSWGGDVRLYGTGWYGDSGWIDAGWKSSGQTFSFSCNIYYTGGSGTTYRSSASGSYTVPQLITAPDPPTSISIRAMGTGPAGLITVRWDFTPTSNKPVTDQELALEINDKWQSAIAISNGTSNVYTLGSGVEDNSRYRARVRLHNSSGWSNYKTSEYLYTTPATPSSATAIKTGNNVSLQAIVSNIRYPKSYQWQRASKSDFSDATTLSGTASSISDTTSLTTPYYRVRCLGQSNTYSGWRTATLTTNPQLYVQIPDGASIKSVYINKD